MSTTNPSEKDYKLKIGTNVRKWRNLKSIKQKHLAAALNLSEAAVSNIENDITNVSLRQMEDIARAIDITVEQLLNDPQENYSNHTISSSAPVFEKELMQAVINSLQKKDEQLQTIMENVITTLSGVMRERQQYPG